MNAWGPQGWLGLNLQASIDVALASAGIYVTLLVLIRVTGQRSLTSMSSTDVAAVLALGSVVGRTTLLTRPTLGSGVVALTTLVAIRYLLAACGSTRLVRLLSRDPVVLVLDGHLEAAGLRRAGVSCDDLRQTLRLAGVTQLDQVGRVVLERNGRISVLRSGGLLDPWLTQDLG